MTELRYGSWPSPIAVEALTSGTVGLSAVRIADDQVFWLEARPDQGGRTGLWTRRIDGGPAKEIAPETANVRSRVHEYGGGEYAVADGTAVYSEFSDGRVWRLRPGDDPAPITPAGAFRYADFELHPDRGLVLAVREDHSGPGEAVNTIVRLELDGENPDGGTVICGGADFYSTPQLSAGGQLAWTQWDHPNMPWDSTTIQVGRLTDQTVEDAAVVAGGPGESVVAPRWLGEQLIFVSDRTDWWNLYRLADGEVQALCPLETEFADPQWQLGQTPYVVLSDECLIVTPHRGGRYELSELSLADGHLRLLHPDAVAVSSLAAVGSTVAAIVGFADRPGALCLLDRTTGEWTDLRRSSEVSLDPATISRAVEVEWTGRQGVVHGWYYPPANAEVSAPPEDRPPLITLSHGGPTACSVPQFAIASQYWTSRGFAILDVNYGGSTGYGRKYRHRLHEAWGIVDVDDCIGGALAMAEQGKADPDQIVIRGGSAGGFTTLAALTRSDRFAAGISLYGVGDLEVLARDTHKFESRYLDGLIGPYPADRERYVERSPIHHVDQLTAPLLLLQGTEDKVVPPNQAELMAAALRAKNLPVALIMFPGEGHGFRSATTIKAAIEAQLYFLGQILRFEPADDLPVIPIDNLS